MSGAGFAFGGLAVGLRWPLSRVAGLLISLDQASTSAYNVFMAEMVNIYDAKTNLSRLIARVEAGEEFTLSRNGRPVARLMPLTPQRARREPGLWKSRVTIADDFDDFSDSDAGEWYSA